MRRVHRSWLSGGIMVALVLAACACGGSSGRSTSTPTPEPTSAPPTAEGVPVTPSVLPTTLPPPAPTSTPTTGAAKAAGPCATSQLTVDITPGQGAAGTEYSGITFRNRSGTTCTLQGYPGVSLLDRNRRQIGQPAARVAETAPVVVLAPGQAATASFSVSPAACNGGDVSAMSASLRVFPPNQRAEVIVAAQVIPCAPRIRPVHAGDHISA